MIKKSILVTSIILAASIIAIVTSQNSYANPPHDVQVTCSVSQTGSIFTYTFNVNNISAQPFDVYSFIAGYGYNIPFTASQFQNVNYVSAPLGWTGGTGGAAVSYGTGWQGSSAASGYIIPGQSQDFVFSSTALPQTFITGVGFYNNNNQWGFTHNYNATCINVPSPPPQPPPPPTTQGNVTVIETVELRWAQIQPNEMYVLLDTSGAGTLNQVNVTTNLPCNGGLGPTPGANNDVPDLVVLAGDFPGTLTRFISNALDDTGARSTANTCIFEDGITSATAGPISSVVLWNNSTSTVTLQRNILFAISGN